MGKIELSDYEKICSFSNLMRAHKAARKGKRNRTEVIRFEMNLSENLCSISQELKDGTYRLAGYYHFLVYDTKTRDIYALRYRDRVVQHCICDEVLEPLLERRLIYDNAACRTGKGTHFALGRVTGFVREYYRKYGSERYILKCDIRKFFDSIDHEELKAMLSRVIKDRQVVSLLNGMAFSFKTDDF